ncbi:hypothetical protein IJ384_03140 [bacterium]|nr:hypothetical protein [bacterium]
MDKKEKEKLSGLIENFTDEFWTIDCLIRMIKEIVTNDNWEIREDDVYYIAKVLAKTSNTLAEQVKNLQLQLQLNK